MPRFARSLAIAPALAAVLIVSALCGCSDSNSSPAGQNAGGPSTLPSPAAKSADTQQRVGEAGQQQPQSEGQGTMGVELKSVTPDEYRTVIAGFKGQVVLVDFWATYCGPCREKYPQTLELARKYAGQGLRVVSMSMDKPEPKYTTQVTAFLTQQKSFVTNLMNRLDDTDAAFEAYKIEGGALPHFKLYNREGKLAKQFGGDPDHPFQEKDIELAVVAALKSK